MVLSRLGKYRIETRLGSGAFGAVYHAIDEVFARPVALKVYEPSTTNGSATLGPVEWDAAFLREARALIKLGHPNVVKVLDATIIEGSPAIIMALVTGLSLQAVLQTTAPMPLLRALPLLAQIGEGIAHIHSNGLVHSDIKPENIIVSNDLSSAVIVDLGLSRDLASSVVAASGGTPRYMAPELWAGEPAVYASDIYSVSVLSYELLTGQPPFPGAGHELMHAHLSATPPPASSFNPSLSTEFDAVVNEGLRKDPWDRPQEVRAFVSKLVSAAGRSTQSARFVTRRVNNPLVSESEGVPAGSEVYFCTRCKEYFALLAYPSGREYPATFSVVPAAALPEPDRATGGIPVFCPRCRAVYGKYGFVLLETNWKEMAVAEHSPLTPASPKTRPLVVMGLELECVVLFLGGRLPEGTALRDVPIEMLIQRLAPDPTAASVLASHGVPLGVVRVDRIIDEAAQIQRALERTYYREVAFGTRVFASGPITIGGPPPLQSMMLCLVGTRMV
jgi:hypothetical protein